MKYRPTHKDEVLFPMWIVVVGIAIVTICQIWVTLDSPHYLKTQWLVQKVMFWSDEPIKVCTVDHWCITKIED